LLILIVGGFTLGCASAGAVGCYMLFTRPYRKTRNRLAIHFGQVFVLISFIVGLLLLQGLEERFSIPRCSSSFYTARYAYLIGLACVMFFVIRAEFRWRRSAGLISNVKKTTAVSGASRQLIVPFVAFIVLSIGFCIAYWVFRPKPISIIFCGISMVCAFAAIIFPSRTVFDRTQMRDVRTSSLLAAAAMSCLFGALAWKFHRTDRTVSLAWLAANVGMLCVVALTAFFFVRPSAGTSPKS
jgi:hypothetical protein